MAVSKLYSASAHGFRPSLLRSRVFQPRALSTQPQRTIAQILEWQPEEEAKQVVINGYVRSVRTMKSEQFVNIGDGSSRKPLQALVPRHMEGSANLRVGAAVRLRGSWVRSKYADQSHELRVDNVDILGPSDAKTFPIQNKYQTPDYLRTIPHLRSRIPLNTSVLRLRSEAIAGLTQFFASRNFIQTQPPIITSSDCEGAGEVFTVSAGLAETPVHPSLASNKPPGLFFRSPKYLTVSAQLHLEALAQSLGNVWTLSPTFRAEKSDTSRHMSEFYMLEAEMSFVEEMDDVMDLVEDMLGDLTSKLYKSVVFEELQSRNTGGGKARTAVDDLVPIAEVDRRWVGMMPNSRSRWPRITYTEAIQLLQAEEHRFEHKPEWHTGLQAEHEKFLATALGASKEGYKPVFVTHYPREIKAFYMRPSSFTPGGNEGLGSLDPVSATVDCFDLLVPELCEIAGGSMREHRLDELLEAMKYRGMVTPSSAPRGNEAGGDSKSGGIGSMHDGSLDWYVDLRRWGSPPHGGFGLGFDRLLSYLTGVQNVRDVVAFPRWHGRCDC